MKSGVSGLKAEYTSQSEKSNIQKSLQKDDFKLFFSKIPHLGTFLYPIDITYNIFLLHLGVLTKKKRRMNHFLCMEHCQDQ